MNNDLYEMVNFDLYGIEDPFIKNIFQIHLSFRINKDNSIYIYIMNFSCVNLFKPYVC